jgi:hypothetical protein
MFFIVPAVPKLLASPPAGDAWIHEVKLDGWRIQLHKEGRSVAIYTKNGHRCAHKLELIAAALTHLPAKSCIIDGELTACDEYGLPNFHALHFHNGRSERCVWAFDQTLRSRSGGDRRPPGNTLRRSVRTQGASPCSINRGAAARSAGRRSRSVGCPLTLCPHTRGGSRARIGGTIGPDT